MPNRVKNSRVDHNYFRHYLLQPLLSLLVCSGIFLLLVVFIPVRFIIDIILRIKYGDRYGGLMDRADSLYLEHNPAMESYNTAMIVIKAKKGKDFTADAVKKVQKRIFDKGDDYKKLTGSVKTFLGYPFLVKGTAKLNDVLVKIKKPLDEPFNMSYMEKYIAEKNSRRFTSTDNGKILWDIHISDEPLDDSKDGDERYILIFRLHHGLSDGTSMFELLIRVLGDDQAQSYSVELFKNKVANKMKTSRSSIWNLTKSIELVKFWLSVIFLSPSSVQLKNSLRTSDKSALHGPKLSGEKIIAVVAEENAECIPLIKKFRQYDKSIKFTDVLLTALAHSFTKFFKRNNQPAPDFLTGVIPILLDLSPTDPEKPVPLKNKPTAAFVELPIMQKDHSLNECLVKISEMTKSQIQYSDNLVTKFLIVDLYGFIPLHIFNWMYGLQAQTFMLTNIPGGSTITLTDNFVVEKFIGIAPNLKGIGVTIAILSYDDRFQIGLQVDQALINSQEEVRQMAEGILTTIKELGQEILQR